MKEKIELMISLPKIPDIELVALEGMDRMANHLGITDGKIGEARILITEAVINAFEHSGANKPNVLVEYEMTREKLIIYIRDYGKGFNPDDVEEPDIKEKMGSTNKRGWGLKLIKTMSDDLTIESDDTGTKITIVKNLV